MYYDEINQADIIDLRNSSKKVEDYNRLISREFNKLVAGTTRGFEGEFVVIKNNVPITEPSQSGANVYMSLGSLGITQAEWVQGTVDIWFKFLSLPNSNGNYPISNWYKVAKSAISNASALLIAPNSITAISTYTAEIIVSKSSTRTKSNTLLHCDIIGNPINYPTAWKQSRVFGTPLIVAEDGTSLLPNGTLDSFKLSRKANATPLLCLRSTDMGTTWTSFTPTFSTTTNAITLTDEPAGNLVMVYYQTHTSMAVPTVNSEVLEIGDGFATNNNNALWGCHLTNSLLGKIPIGATYFSLGNLSNKRFQISGVLLDMSSSQSQKILQGNSVSTPSHNSILLTDTATPTVKVLPYLTRLNGKAYLNLVFKEMKHNGTSWGDSSKFEIVDNVSTTTDLNAQTVLIGQKTVELPYFIAGDA